MYNFQSSESGTGSPVNYSIKMSLWWSGLVPALLSSKNTDLKSNEIVKNKAGRHMEKIYNVLKLLQILCTKYAGIGFESSPVMIMWF
jgi:hypothetical protein